MSWLTN